MVRVPLNGVPFFLLTRVHRHPLQMLRVVGVVEAPAEVHVPQLAGPVVLLPREEVAGRPPILALLGCGAEPRALAF